MKKVKDFAMKCVEIIQLNYLLLVLYYLCCVRKNYLFFFYSLIPTAHTVCDKSLALN